MAPTRKPRGGPPSRTNLPRRAKAVAIHRIQRANRKRGTAAKRTTGRPRVVDRRRGAKGRGGHRIKWTRPKIQEALRELKRHKDTKNGRGFTAMELGRALRAEDRAKIQAEKIKRSNAADLRRQAQKRRR